MKEGGPKMPLVSKSNSFACRAERLAGARACPNWSAIGPSCESERVTPSSDTREEMALSVSGEFGRFNIINAPCVYVTICNMSASNEHL
jgi:hypothetical protein